MIEGWHLFEEAVSGAELIRIFALAEYAERLADFSQVIFVSSEILADLADSKTPQGIVAEVAFEREENTIGVKWALSFLGGRSGSR